ncbi:hypothetical protein [Rhizobium terrae]|uniref:hypothetical protein n=1 Tax=Rhizobium terrae TaxID=2171756 RepID=UPI000E3E899B|nr:hypothetical protein [Rhizobium terrae]
MARSSAELVAIELKKVARKARTPRPMTTGGGGFQQRRNDRRFRHLLIVSTILLWIIPSIAGGIYYGWIAADQFITEARFTIRSGETSAGLGNLGSLSAFIDSGQARDGLIVADYVTSRPMVEELLKTHDLRAMFRPATPDLIARLGDSLPIEDLVKYWKRQVDVNVDRNSGLLSLKIRAFTPQDSLALTSSVVSISERMVNELTRRNEIDAVNETKLELGRAKSSLDASVNEMREERDRAGILDVDAAEKGFNAIITSLRLDLSRKEQRLATLSAMNAGQSPEVGVLNKEIDILKGQISDYENKIAGQTAGNPGHGPNLAAQAVGLRQAEIHVEVARKEYQKAFAEYELARITAERQRSYLLTYVEPHLAEDSLYPQRGMMSGAIFIGSFFVWALFAGLAFVVRDNMAK